TAIGVHVLSEQRHLANALRGEPRDLGEHVVERARDFVPARVRNDAEAAVLAAAFHDRDEGARAFAARRRHPVELLDLGEADVDLRTAGGAATLDHLGQAVQRLRPEDEIDVGRAPDDRLALLAGDAAADADQQIGSLALERARAPELGDHLLLCLLAHRAGVEQDDVGVLDAVGPARAFARRQDVGHAVGVVLVHLAPEGADVQLLRHRLLLRSRAAASSAGVRIQTRAIWPEASSATRTSYVPDSDAGITMRL